MSVRGSGRAQAEMLTASRYAVLGPLPSCCRTPLATSFCRCRRTVLVSSFNTAAHSVVPRGCLIATTSKTRRSASLNCEIRLDAIVVARVPCFFPDNVTTTYPSSKEKVGSGRPWSSIAPRIRVNPEPFSSIKPKWCMAIAMCGFLLYGGASNLRSLAIDNGLRGAPGLRIITAESEIVM